jgi:hypothetical protein
VRVISMKKLSQGWQYCHADAEEPLRLYTRPRSDHNGKFKRP